MGAGLVLGTGKNTVQRSPERQLLLHSSKELLEIWADKSAGSAAGERVIFGSGSDDWQQEVSERSVGSPPQPFLTGISSEMGAASPVLLQPQHTSRLHSQSALQLNRRHEIT